ncbi:MAG: tetratricopeptide repeat protein, partial [Leptolyngbya sp. SIO4C5]|nr:tetratricopeptide repeat protein [Leptolyngbya sp. SIO4C5]
MFLRLLAAGVLGLWVGAEGAIAARQAVQIEKNRDSQTLISQTDENAPITITGELNSDSAVLEDDGSYYAVHSFEGEAGENIAISLSSEDFDAYLILQGPDGSTVAQDNDSGDGTNAYLVGALSESGTYQVIANTYNEGEVGQYELQWRYATATEQTLADAISLNQQMIQLYQAARYGEAIPIAEQVLALRRTTLEESHPAVAQSLNNLALLYQAQGRYVEAEPLYQESLEIRQTVLGESHPAVATSLNNLANLYQAQGRYVEAKSLYQESLEIRQAVLGESHPAVATSLSNLALLYQAQGRYAEAEPLYQESLDILRTVLGESHPNVATSLNNLANLYQAQGRYAEA